MVASARRPVAAVAPRPEDRPRWRTGLVVGAPRHLDLRHRAGSAGDPGPSVRDFGDFLDSDRAEDFFRGRVGLVRGGRGTRRLQHGARRGAPLSGSSAAANEGRIRKVGLGRQPRCSRPTTCTSRGTFPPRSWTSSLSPIPFGGSRASGWGSSCTRPRASSSSSSPSYSASRPERVGVMTGRFAREGRGFVRGQSLS